MQGQLKYTVDIVVCIDATGSMGSIIERVKSNALKFYDDVEKRMQTTGKFIDTLRIKVIAFRDYYHDGDNALKESPFFTLPDEKEAFTNFVRTIKAEGGGDDPESGLEALALAMKSDWSKSGNRKRQIIVVWTDTSAHPLDKNSDSKPANYPADMPKDLSELTNMWHGQSYMNESAKRLIIYAPDAYAWTEIYADWDEVMHHTSKAGEGLKDVDYTSILDTIERSV